MLIFLSLQGFGQAFYSTRPDYLSSKAERNNLFSGYRYNYPDTSIIDEHNYFPRNFLGNLGLPSPDYFLSYGTPDMGFTFFNPPTQIDRFRENEIEYYRSKGPYARLTGIAGSKQLQIFKLFFTTTYKRVNVTLKFHRYTSQGFYLKQQTYSNNFYLTSNYTTLNKRFGYYFFILNNSNKNQENGGIKDGTLNDSTVALDKALLNVNISSANRTNSETKVMLNPWLRLNKPNDSLKGPDSLKGYDHYIQFKSRVAFNLYRYKDDNSGSDQFYHLFYRDTAKTFDSSHVTQFSNEIDYAVMSVNKKLSASAGYKNEINKVWQYGRSSMTNHLLVGDVVFRTNLPVKKDTLSKDTLKHQRFFESLFNLQAVFAGYNDGNIKAESNSSLVLDANKRHEVFFNALFERRNPDYIYNNWLSNHFQWQNNGYQPQEQLQLRLGARLGRYIGASVFYQSIFNYLYFDQVAFPRQYNNYIQNVGVTLTYTHIFFKHLGLGISHTLQSTSNDQYIRIPPNVTTAKLFFNGDLFRHNMQVQIGAQIQVYQSFKGYGYMPATQVFYLQNTTAAGTYPYIDAYLNVRIRPVSVFLKIENALQGFVGTNYSFVPGYYQPDMAFRFGISWMFFD